MLWNLLKNKQNRGLFEIYRRLFIFRHKTDVLRNGQVTFFYENIDDRVLVYRRGEDILVLCHFSNKKRANYVIQDVSTQPNTSWIDILTNEYFTVNGRNTLILTLNSYDGRVLFRTNKRHFRFCYPLSILCSHE
jgi:glycosidase